jgi:hypothetical protein
MPRGCTRFEVDARIEYMQMIAERILKPAGALAVTAAPAS